MYVMKVLLHNIIWFCKTHHSSSPDIYILCNFIIKSHPLNFSTDMVNMCYHLASYSYIDIYNYSLYSTTLKAFNWKNASILADILCYMQYMKTFLLASFRLTHCEHMQIPFFFTIFIPLLLFDKRHKSCSVVYVSIYHTKHTLPSGLYHHWWYSNEEGYLWPSWGGIIRRSGGCGGWLGYC